MQAGIWNRALAFVLLAFAPAAWTAEAAIFPFGVYDKATLAPGTDAWIAYYERLFAVLAEHDLNTLVTVPYRQAEPLLAVMDQARANGVGVIMSVGNPLNRAWDFLAPGYPFYKAYKHPAVIALKYGDEPASDEDLRKLRDPYQVLRRSTRLPVVTAMVGERMSFDEPDFAGRAWVALGTEVRFARHYPIRRGYDLENWYRDKMTLPFDEWAARMEQSAAGPWWCIVQTFGQGTEKGEAAYWRLPTAAELGAMVHLALAHGARGVIGYALQDHSEGKLLGLVDAGLAPRRARDGSQPLAKYAELARLVKTHAQLLLRHRRAAFAVDISASSVVAVPRTDPVSRRDYLYLVNKDAEHAASGTFGLPGLPAMAVARNLYAPAEARTAMKVDANRRFSWTLGPGEGQLWELAPE